MVAKSHNKLTKFPDDLKLSSGQERRICYSVLLHTEVSPYFPSFPTLMSLSSLKRGFTLIELLLVIGIIAILAAIVIVAINPTKQLGDARNAQRRSDVNTILNAVYQYSIDKNGNMPATIGTTATPICKNDAASCQFGVVLDVLVDDSYVISIPFDPNKSTTTGSNYLISKNATTNRITVEAPGAENSQTISVTR